MKPVRRLKRKRPNDENFKNEELKKYSVPEKPIVLLLLVLLLSCGVSAVSVSKVVLNDTLYDNVDELRVGLSLNGSGNFSVVDAVWDFYDETERYYSVSGDGWSTEYVMSVYRAAEDYELNISSVKVYDGDVLVAESLPFSFLVKGFNYVPDRSVSTRMTLVISLIVVLALIIAVILLIVRRKETADEVGDDYELVEVEE
jgi:nitrate reductase gamma subunit